MITIIIGQAGCGKTTYVKNTFAIGNGIYNTIPIKHTLYGNNLLIGDYVSDKRCLGTDTLAYNVLPKIIEFIKDNCQKFNIVAEGDRINNKKFFEEISSFNVAAEVVVLTCSLEESIKRLRQNGSKITEKFVKATRTKTLNNKELCKKLNLKIIEKEV